jgi:predicted component of type VI protein secretion system
MDDSEYSDDDTSQELLLDAHQPVVVQNRAVESTHTHYRAQKLVKILRGRKLLIQETTTMRMIRIRMMNIVIHKIRNKTSKKGLYEGARKGQKRAHR